MVFMKKKSQKISKKYVFILMIDKFLIENAKSEIRYIYENYILFLDMGYPKPHDNYFSLENQLQLRKIIEKVF